MTHRLPLLVVVSYPGGLAVQAVTTAATQEHETPPWGTGVGLPRGGWWRFSLPATSVGNTIGAAGLNGRVRDGNGCDPRALVASHVPAAREDGDMGEAWHHHTKGERCERVAA